MLHADRVQPTNVFIDFLRILRLVFLHLTYVNLELTILFIWKNSDRTENHLPLKMTSTFVKSTENYGFQGQTGPIQFGREVSDQRAHRSDQQPTFPIDLAI